MRDRPRLSDERITAIVQAHYGLPIVEITFLSLGHDADSFAFRLLAADGARTYLKARSEAGFRSASLLVPHCLHNQGVPHLVPPLPTQTGALFVPIDGFVCSLYPFINGRIGGDAGLTAVQWRAFGHLVRQVHQVRLPPDVHQAVPKEPFVPTRRELIERLETTLLEGDFTDPAKAAFAATWQEHRAAVQHVFAQADTLGQALRRAALPTVLCHADMHPWNLLVTEEHLWLIDWDETIYAPKERDLMFAIGGIGGDGVGPEQTAAFLHGYGRSDIDRNALVYYRSAWAVQDIAAYGEVIFFRPGLSEATRHDAVQGFRSLFRPGNIVRQALANA